MALSFASCTVSVAPVRREPSHRSEQTSQLLFGEKAEILQASDSGWMHIRCVWDDYEGWCQGSQLLPMAPKEYKKAVSMAAPGHHNRLILEEGELWLPAGSELTGMKGGKIRLDQASGKYKGRRIRPAHIARAPADVRAAALSFLHAPYQWGGRSAAGIDCSGLSGIAYKLCGQPLPRDAWQQAGCGEAIDFLTEALPGDLLFFDNAAGKIVHVGILLEGQMIVHATENSGRVVVDRIDPEGIISVSLKKRTHNLRIIRRIIREIS